MRFPQYLHRPFQVLWWEADQIAILVLLLTVSFMWGGFRGWRLLFWIIPVAGCYVYSRAKRKYPRGFLKHMVYFAGFTDLKGYPTYFEDHFTE